MYRGVAVSESAIKITGDKSLIKAIHALGGVQGKKAIRKGTREGQKRLLPAVGGNIRKKTGALYKSLKVRAIKRNTKVVGHTLCMGGANFVGKGKDNEFYGIFQEYGTKWIKASYAMRDTADSVGPQCLDTAEQFMWREIERQWLL